MALGIRVNFHKSKILGFNIDLVFLEATFDFFACSITYLLSISWEFLLVSILEGVAPGSNYRKSFTVDFQAGNVISFHMDVILCY